jgi:MFS family permease
MLVVMLFASGLIVFPHYQALAREELGLSGVHLVVWVVTQNLAVAAYSLFVGPLADRRGNRITMRLLLFASAVPPAFVVSLPYLPEGLGARLFWLVYIPLGVTPLVLRTVQNYALEICEPDDHPRYLSTVSLGLAVPFLLSPLVGWLVDVAGFKAVFFATVGLICLSGLLTFRLEEPRYRFQDVQPQAFPRTPEE